MLEGFLPVSAQGVWGLSTVSCTRSERSCLRFLDCPNRAVASAILAGLVLLGSVDGQTSKLKRLQQQAAQNTKPVLSASEAVAAPPIAVPPPANPVPVAPEPERPSQPPVISWDGKQLTIDADNASLSDILLGIRSRTGASIEMPPSTSAERVAVHLGPAPVRDVLSSLLYGTQFNYVIQSSDGDADSLGMVILTAREKDASDNSPAGSATADRSVRLMPGYAAPGKRDFEVGHENAASDSASNAAAEVPSTDGLVITTDPPSDNAKADSQAAPSTSSDSGDTSAAASDAGTLGQPSPAGAITSASSSQPASGDAPISKMEQDLQHMYEQRKQIQAQQNHPQPPGPGN